jgi:hypothetical protein
MFRWTHFIDFPGHMQAGKTAIKTSPIPAANQIEHVLSAVVLARKPRERWSRLIAQVFPLRCEKNA